MILLARVVAWFRRPKVDPVDAYAHAAIQAIWGGNPW